MKSFKEMIRPFLVLVIISVLVGALLGLTNHITAPIIEENARIEAENTRKALLPSATEFEPLEVSDAHDIDSAYIGHDADGNTVGYIISVTRSGYKSVSATVAIGTDGKILDLSVDASSETQGIGSKVGDRGYFSKYIGVSGSADGVDLISQATYSSTALRNCVGAALAVFEEIGGAANER